MEIQDMLKANPKVPDPTLDSFLTFLYDDIVDNSSQQLNAATPELATRIQSLIGNQDIDLEASLDDEDD